jgi:BirA family transcriptional regulator, biotin operon repressor / biotin---[acetyl-CoA-carboxylase] ligase
VRFGRPHRHYRRCESTNSHARELAAGGAPSGLVVTAEEQTAGRGRQGRTWVAPAGKALLYSALLRPLDERHLLLPLAVPLAVCEAAERLGGGPCRVKWPNDVLSEDRKCAGVLIEARPRDGWAVIGVGLNLSIEPDEFPPELRGTAISIGGADPAAALAALNERLGAWAEAEPAAVLHGFRERDALRGREVAWEGGEGTAEGVDDRGNLLVRRADREVESLGAGEVHLRLD